MVHTIDIKKALQFDDATTTATATITKQLQQAALVNNKAEDEDNVTGPLPAHFVKYQATPTRKTIVQKQMSEERKHKEEEIAQQIEPALKKNNTTSTTTNTRKSVSFSRQIETACTFDSQDSTIEIQKAKEAVTVTTLPDSPFGKDDDMLLDDDKLPEDNTAGTNDVPPCLMLDNTITNLKELPNKQQDTTVTLSDFKSNNNNTAVKHDEIDATMSLGYALRSLGHALQLPSPDEITTAAPIMQTTSMPQQQQQLQEEDLVTPVSAIVPMMAFFDETPEQPKQVAKEISLQQEVEATTIPERMPSPPVATLLAPSPQQQQQQPAQAAPIVPDQMDCAEEQLPAPEAPTVSTPSKAENQTNPKKRQRSPNVLSPLPEPECKIRKLDEVKLNIEGQTSSPQILLQRDPIINVTQNLTILSPNPFEKSAHKKNAQRGDVYDIDTVQNQTQPSRKLVFAEPKPVVEDKEEKQETNNANASKTAVRSRKNRGKTNAKQAAHEQLEQQQQQQDELASDETMILEDTEQNIPEKPETKTVVRSRKRTTLKPAAEEAAPIVQENKENVNVSNQIESKTKTQVRTRNRKRL